VCLHWHLRAMQIGRMYSLDCWYNGIYFSGIVNVVSISFQNISSPEMGTYSNVFSRISVLTASLSVFPRLVANWRRSKMWATISAEFPPYINFHVHKPRNPGCVPDYHTATPAVKPPLHLLELTSTNLKKLKIFSQAARG